MLHWAANQTPGSEIVQPLRGSKLFGEYESVCTLYGPGYTNNKLFV